MKRPFHWQVDNLADLFAKSPFRGLDMVFERDREGLDVSSDLTGPSPEPRTERFLRQSKDRVFGSVPSTGGHPAG
jgi:hypothetical protein